jgi:hypothetical protein
MGAIHPWQPLAQVLAVRFCKLENGLRIGGLKEPHFEPGAGLAAKRILEMRAHGTPAGFCGLRDREMAGVSGVSTCKA